MYKRRTHRLSKTVIIGAVRKIRTAWQQQNFCNPEINKNRKLLSNVSCVLLYLFDRGASVKNRFGGKNVWGKLRKSFPHTFTFQDFLTF
jgi:hypothetical protein